jgi:hypothetical protein
MTSIGGGCFLTGVNPVRMVVACRRERGVVVSGRLLGKLSEVKTCGGTVSQASKSSGARLFLPIETGGSGGSSDASRTLLSRGFSTTEGFADLAVIGFGSGVFALAATIVDLGRCCEPDASAIDDELGREASEEELGRELTLVEDLGRVDGASDGIVTAFGAELVSASFLSRVCTFRLRVSSRVLSFRRSCKTL